MPESPTSSASHAHLEFTGERVVPGLVDPNLLNEHIARYRFAAAFSGGADVLDAGCGSGYGSEQLQGARSVTSFDLSYEAVAWAKEKFSRPAVRFLCAACESIPFADASFDLMIAFELIEHLERWPELIAEARRVLRPGGVLLVSTPNRTYYAESRAEAGPNPWHIHEFERVEFESALKNVFPHVRMWTQNHSEAIVFSPPVAAHGAIDSEADPDPDNAHFFLAACSTAPLAEAQSFAWVPRAGNVLRDRERHVALLAEEIQRKNTWLREAEDDRARLLAEHNALLAELKEHNDWAADLNARLAQSGTRIAALQTELESVHAGYRVQIQTHEQEMVQRLAWVRDLESQIACGRQEVARLDAETKEVRARAREILDRFDAAVERGNRLEEKLEKILRSRWARFGRALHVWPQLQADPSEGDKRNEGSKG